ncbi:MAG TPA: glucosyl-3-phosphoglycerate synthase, partial [Thermoleophilaceae bacterium]|nr:glucosyl-3-phosphoglycerate synthase [Thermoleophilaceae bacterium]
MTDAERARRWHESRTFHHSDFPPERLAADRTRAVSVCVPARNEEATIGAIVADLVGLRESGAIDEVLVVDAGSSDRTAEIATAAGANVRQETTLLPQHGPVLGKGDAMWRALSVLRGEVIVYLDADSEGFGPHFACGLAGPLACGPPGIEFVKGFYRRPLRLGEVSLPEGGGRVTELMARPLLNLFYPQLAGVRQPLAGEFAATRDLLHRLPFATGYAVEIAMLIDAWKEVGLDALAQVDIEMRQNRHQPLGDLTPMAYAVLRAVAIRLEREGRLREFEEAGLLLPSEDGLTEKPLPMAERPPLGTMDQD